MERLLGSRASFVPEHVALASSHGQSPRGAPYEEFAEWDNESTPSALAPAIRRASREHAKAMAQLPLGGPKEEQNGPQERDVPPSREDRAPLRVVPVALDSYSGVGVVARNRKRAARRKAQRAARQAKAAASS